MTWSSAEPAFAIGERTVGGGAPCFVVAEIGANHDGDPQRCLELVRMAAAAGADAIKLQTYTAAELLADGGRVIRWGRAGAEREEAVGAMFDRLALPRAAHADLFAEARRLGLAAFSTPFSLDGVAFLDGLGVPAFKIASSDIGWPELLAAAAGTGKPVIMSTGKHTLAEVANAICDLEGAGVRGLGLLHCIAQYPAPQAALNLRTIPVLKALYPRAVVGFSDHSIGIAAAQAAVALGARIVERHVTYDRGADGPDHWFSSDPAEFAALVRGIRDVEAALGGSKVGIDPSEELERHNSVRSLVMARAVRAGDVLCDDDLVALRPGWGIPPRQRSTVIGRRAPRDLPAGTVLTWDALDETP